LGEVGACDCRSSFAEESNCFQFSTSELRFLNKFCNLPKTRSAADPFFHQANNVPIKTQGQACTHISKSCHLSRILAKKQSASMKDNFPSTKELFPAPKRGCGLEKFYSSDSKSKSDFAKLDFVHITYWLQEKCGLASVASDCGLNLLNGGEDARTAGWFP
jgi:hypothetical protein